MMTLENAKKRTTNFRLTLFLIILLLLFGAGVSFYHIGFSSLLGFFANYSFQFLIYLGCVFIFFKQPSKINLRIILMGALGLRIICFLSEPYYENDYFRYLWDGAVLNEGLNPYNYLPSDPRLDGIDDSLRQKVEWSEYKTVYPPLAQYFFGLHHAVFGSSIWSLKLFFGLLELLMMGLLLRIKPHGYAVVLYSLNPLPLKEISNFGHYESLLLLLLVLSLFFLTKGKKYGAWISLSLAVGAKLVPVVLAPFLWQRSGRGWSGLLLFFCLIFLLWLPFLTSLEDPSMGLYQFFTEWHWNAPLFHWVSDLWLSRWLLFASALGWLFYLFIKKTKKTWGEVSLYGLLGVILLMPTVQPHYILWILPFACLQRSFAAISLSYFISFGYLMFLFDHQSQIGVTYILILEYGFWLLSLFVWAKTKHRSAGALMERFS